MDQSRSQSTALGVERLDWTRPLNTTWAQHLSLAGLDSWASAIFQTYMYFPSAPLSNVTPCGPQSSVWYPGLMKSQTSGSTLRWLVGPIFVDVLIKVGLECSMKSSASLRGSLSRWIGDSSIYGNFGEETQWVICTHHGEGSIAFGLYKNLYSLLGLYFLGLWTWTIGFLRCLDLQNHTGVKMQQRESKAI